MNLSIQDLGALYSQAVVAEAKATRADLDRVATQWALTYATKKPKLDEKSVIEKHGGARPGTGGARPGAGRKSFNPTDAERKQAEAMSSYGVPFDQIAVLVRDGIGTDTLRKYFSKELLVGKAKANAKVGRTLFQKAMGGDTVAMIWWSKTQMHWQRLKN